jgi:hypothetical protein
MDEDDPFGGNVWDTNYPSSSKAALELAPDNIKRGFEFEKVSTATFDDFESGSDGAGGGGEDDFGDFGDFGDADTTTASALESASAYPDDFRIPQTFTSGYWEPLELDPQPHLEMLEDQVVSLLEPIWQPANIDGSFNHDPVRASEGVSSILVNPER